MALTVVMDTMLMFAMGIIVEFGLWEIKNGLGMSVLLKKVSVGGFLLVALWSI